MSAKKCKKFEVWLDGKNSHSNPTIIENPNFHDLPYCVAVATKRDDAIRAIAQHYGLDWQALVPEIENPVENQGLNGKLFFDVVATDSHPWSIIYGMYAVVDAGYSIQKLVAKYFNP